MKIIGGVRFENFGKGWRCNRIWDFPRNWYTAWREAYCRQVTCVNQQNDGRLGRADWLVV